MQRNSLATLAQNEPAAALPKHAAAAAVAAEALHASINTTRSSLDSSANTTRNSAYTQSSASAASSPALDRTQHSLLDNSSSSMTGLECDETLDESTSSLSAGEVGTLAANYSSLLLRTQGLASAAAVERVHNQSLQIQLRAADVWRQQVEGENARLLAECAEWKAKAEASENNLRHTQILLACATAAPAASASAAASPSTESELQRLSAHHRSALAAKDALVSQLLAERERSESALRDLRAEFATAVSHAAQSRYNDAIVGHEHRQKFQEMMTQQMAQLKDANQALELAAANATAAAVKSASAARKQL